MRRFIWTVRLASIFFVMTNKYALRMWQEHKSTPRQAWSYARGLAGDDDFYGDGMTPSQALSEDMQYWEG